MTDESITKTGATTMKRRTIFAACGGAILAAAQRVFAVQRPSRPKDVTIDAMQFCVRIQGAVARRVWEAGNAGGFRNGTAHIVNAEVSRLLPGMELLVTDYGSKPDELIAYVRRMDLGDAESRLILKRAEGASCEMFVYVNGERYGKRYEFLPGDDARDIMRRMASGGARIVEEKV